MDELLLVFKALSDKTRLKIILIISKKNVCAKGLSNHLNISKAAVSQHIKILKDADLIYSSKYGYHIHYFINQTKLDKISYLIKNLSNFDITASQPKTNKNFLCFGDLLCLKSCCIKNLKEDNSMKICIPIGENKGLESLPYNHFGSAPMFLVVDSNSKETTTLKNGDLNHEHGKCQPLKAIGNSEIDVVLSCGIGASAINKLNSMGIKVYSAKKTTISENIDLLLQDKLDIFNSNNACAHHDCSNHKDSTK